MIYCVKVGEEGLVGIFFCFTQLLQTGPMTFFFYEILLKTKKNY